MLFSELPLFIATWKVFEQVDQNGSDTWITKKSRLIYKMVIQQIVDDESFTEDGIPWNTERVTDVWMQLRKGPKFRILCEVAVNHGSVCYYFYRGKGPCSEDVDLDRIVPESRGGFYVRENCQISCSRHNRMRGDQNIETFLARREIGVTPSEPPCPPASCV